MDKEKVTISVRIDKDVKNQFEKVCKSIGINISEAINIFARKVISEDAIPFEVKRKVHHNSLILFEEVFRLLEEYKSEHGHCEVPKDYKVGDIHLGWIVQNIRKGARKTNAQQKAMLDSIGFVWKSRESPTSFEEVLRLLIEYKEEHGHCKVPKDYKVGNVHLGWIVHGIRNCARKTTAEQKAMLDSIGFVWKSKESHTSFEELFRLLEEYKEEHGHCKVPQNYKVGNVHLGRIVQGIRNGARKTTAEQKAMLDSISFVWKSRESPTSFEEVLRLIKEYKEEHGHCKVPQDYKIGNVNLGVIVQNIRAGMRETTDEQKTMLDSIGFVWKVKNRKK